MRFKAKHSYFKQLAQSMGNFVNIVYSLATRHQLHQCHLNIDKQHLPGLEHKLESGPGISHSNFYFSEISCIPLYAGSVIDVISDLLKFSISSVSGIVNSIV